MTYEARRRQVLGLRAQGLTYREIAERLGISLDHARRTGSSRTSYATRLRASREAKRHRGGHCRDCGGPTKYNGHGIESSLCCVLCSNRRIAKSLRGTGPLQRQLFAFLGENERRFGEIREALDITPGHTSSLLNRVLKYGLVERVARGRYRMAV